jgi:hypothetical protein
MSGHADDETPASVQIASQLAEAPDGEWQRIFESLRRRRELSSSVHQMNKLLAHPIHADVARQALRKMGLLHGG